MSGSFLRKALLVGALVSALAVLLRALRGGPVPAFGGGDRTDPPAAPWPTLRPAESMSTPPAPAPTAPAQAPDWAGPAWIEVPDGAPPESYPVKAKLTSGIYHLPGMMNYERTKPDRCYRTAADAEADGLRPAKR